MKKWITVLVLALISVSAIKAQGHFQLSLSTSFGPNNSYKPENISFIPNADIKAAYLFHLGSRLQLGAGLGLGISTFTHCETDGITSEEGPVHNIKVQMSPSIPFFAIAKMNIINQTNTPFIKIEGGYRLAWADDSYKGRFNPYTFNIIPSVGYEFAIRKHKLGFELGAEWIGYKKTYQPAKSDYLLDGGLLNITANNFNGVYFACTLSF